MAEIRPFCAYRPKKGLEGRIAALPYDVYNRAEAKAEVQKEPLSFLSVDRAETQFDDSVDVYADCVYEKRGNCFGKGLRKDTLYRRRARFITYMSLSWTVDPRPALPPAPVWMTILGR